MSELEEVKKELATLQEKVAKMEQAKNEPVARWRPSNGEKYQIIFSSGEIDQLRYDGDAIDLARVDACSAFPVDMPIYDVALMLQFIKEMELILWQLGIKKPESLCSYVIQTNGGKICYRFDSIDQRDKAKSMLSDKVKKWLDV